MRTAVGLAFCAALAACAATPPETAQTNDEPLQTVSSEEMTGSPGQQAAQVILETRSQLAAIDVSRLADGDRTRFQVAEDLLLRAQQALTAEDLASASELAGKANVIARDLRSR